VYVCHFGNIGVASPTCTDDIVILANSDTELQGILDIVHHHTQRDLVKINPEKSDLIAYNAKDEKIEKSEKRKHLGIVRNGKNTVDIEVRLKSGRGTIYGLLGAGLQVRKGFSTNNCAQPLENISCVAKNDIWSRNYVHD
jgi:hypothetical protein